MHYPKQTDNYDVDIFNQNFREIANKNLLNEANLQDEIARAKEAERANANAISAETSRAMVAEQSNSDAIAAETNRALVQEALKAPIESPAFTGAPQAPTPETSANDLRIATTAFVKAVINALVDGAPETLDTLKEIADAIAEHREVTDALNAAIGAKVDKVAGKGLSTNDYTTAEKDKLFGIGAGAEINVQPDWDVNDPTSAAFIKNKPTSLVIDGIEIRDLYNRVITLENTVNRRFTQVINLTSGYDPNTWYPVIGTDIPQAGMRYLNAYTLLYQCKPSWSTHVGGYSCNITMLVNGSAWGVNKENMNLCLNHVCAWTQNNNENPVSFNNLLQSQTPVLYCRGGGYYTVVTDWESVWTPITTSYTKNDQTVVPIGSSPRVNIDGASGSVVYGKDRYITKNDRIENNTFTDELVHNGFWKLGDFADANYAKSIGIDENTGDFYAIVFNYYGAGDSHTMGFGNIILLSPRLGTKFYFIQVWNKSLHVKKFG